MGRGRGRVEVRRIDNSVSRQVTFSKRRRGLAKKARELAVLCDADVALLVFSDKGRLHDFAAHASMEQILERYERYLICEGGDNALEDLPEELEENMSYDQIKLRSRIEALKKSQRNLMGEQLESLTLREVQQIELQIDSALRNIRSRKDRILLQSIEELRKKESFLIEQNSVLEKERAELESRQSKNRNAPTTAPAVTLPNLNICVCNDDSEDPIPVVEPAAATGGGGGLPWWMLRPPVSRRRPEED